MTESRGVPSVSVLTSAFIRAAHARAAALGMPGVRLVVLPSPLASRSVAEVQRLAHTIKGAVDSCGATQAYDAAMLLERMGRGGEFEGARAQYAKLDQELARVRPELVVYIARDREN